MYLAVGKRLLDVSLTVPSLLVLSPLIALIALLVRIKLGSPIFFIQQRPGQHGRPFTLLKFRTMRDTRAAEGDLLQDDQRLTPFGRFLRGASLDELPELLNVLKGDMSLVGPRPLLMKYLPYYSDQEAIRNNMRPGITGWAQVKGRNHLPWDERL